MVTTKWASNLFDWSFYTVSAMLWWDSWALSAAVDKMEFCEKNAFDINANKNKVSQSSMSCTTFFDTINNRFFADFGLTKPTLNPIRQQKWQRMRHAKISFNLPLPPKRVLPICVMQMHATTPTPTCQKNKWLPHQSMTWLWSNVPQIRFFFLPLLLC